MSSSDTVGTRITTTDYQYILALAVNQFVLRELHTGEDTVLLRKQLEGEINTLQFSSRNFQVAGCRCTGRYHVGIEAFRQLGNVNMLVVSEFNTLLFEKTETAVDDALVELEVWNTITQQTTGILTSLENCYLISHVVQLVGSYQSCRTGTDDSHRLAITLRNLNMYIILREGVLHDSTLILTVGGWLMIHEIQYTRLLTECRTDASCELRKVVGGIEETVSLLPIALVEGIIPLRCLVAQRTSPVTERHTTIHAT
ncbi:putative uncharacterized protein [Segatella copri CAG:164]|nr:putative uncharacterized protein [Segatella copri CAG:164]